MDGEQMLKQPPGVWACFSPHFSLFYLTLSGLTLLNSLKIHQPIILSFVSAPLYISISFPEEHFPLLFQHT